MMTGFNLLLWTGHVTAEHTGILKGMKKAGYDPKEMIQVLVKLEKEADKKGTRPFSYWKTHPGLAKRKAAVNTAITGQLEFRDYLNLMEDK